MQLEQIEKIIKEDLKIDEEPYVEPLIKDTASDDEQYGYSEEEVVG